MGQPHKHAEIIKAWADGSEIEFRNPNLMLTSMPPKPDTWKAVQPDHAWNEFWEYRIKPEAPKYPQTTMTEDELFAAFHRGQQWRGFLRPVYGGAKSVANAAIARAIEDKQVFTADAVQDVVDAANIGMVPAAMLEKVALEVQKACKPTLIGPGGGIVGGGTGGNGSSSICRTGYSQAMQVHIPTPDLSAIIAKVKEDK